MEKQTYKNFIQNILDVRGRHGCGEEYYETHHIVPRCMGGNDDDENLIDLFAREHFIAHKLLAQENPDNDKLIYAWWMMAHIDNRSVTPEEYEEAKTIFSKLRSKAQKELWENEEYYNKQTKALKESWTDEIRKKQSKKQTGRIVSEETIQKQSYIAQALWADKEYRNKQTKAVINGWNKRRQNNPKGYPRGRKIIRLSDGKIYNRVIEACRENNISEPRMRRMCTEQNEFMYHNEWLDLQNNI